MQHPLAVVGEISINVADLHGRVGVFRAYGNKIERDTALVALINEGIKQELAREVGIAPGQDELHAFALQVERNSKAPEMLAAVKTVFKDDMDAYQRIYLTPKVINSKLRGWFSRNAQLHQQQRDIVERAWVLVHTGYSFEAAAKETGAQFSAGEYGQISNRPPDAVNRRFSKSLDSISEPFHQILNATAPGEIAATIAEDDYSYHIIKLVDKKGDSYYETEEIGLAKASFDKWLKQQASHIPV